MLAMPNYSGSGFGERGKQSYYVVDNLAGELVISDLKRQSKLVGSCEFDIEN